MIISLYVRLFKHPLNFHAFDFYSSILTSGLFKKPRIFTFIAVVTLLRTVALAQRLKATGFLLSTQHIAIFSD